jgi:hypothetical protein
MREANKQTTCPVIAGSAVLADARHEAGPMLRTAANRQKRQQRDTYGSHLCHASTNRTTGTANGCTVVHTPQRAPSSERSSVQRRAHMFWHSIGIWVEQ